MTQPIRPAAMVSSGLCVGCGACVSERGGMAWNRHGHLEPVGPSRMESSEHFARLCPFSPAAEDEDSIALRRFPDAAFHDGEVGRHEAAYVGHAARGGFRAGGSSGGMVTWVAAELLARGLVDGVAHVVPTGRAEGTLFRFRISRTEAEVRQGARSRYHPVELSAVLAEIRAVPGRYAIVGIPCFIKAVHLASAQDRLLEERVAYRLGLFCGHMKSRHMVDSFAWQMGARGEEVEAIDYRVKDERRPANWYRARLALSGGETRERDWWHLVDGDWGSGFFQNSACDWCDDVVAETADISFGDAWVEPHSSDGRGTNVVVARSRDMRDLIERGRTEGRLMLDPVDAAFVRETQAAGFRHRREGLAYRLSWPSHGVQPVKRVTPHADGLPLRRRLVYRMRYRIARGSPAMFRLARRIGQPALFLWWGRAMLVLYQALAYSRGRLGRLVDWVERRAA